LPSVVNWSIITAIELISGIGQSVCHVTLPLALLAAALSTFLWKLKHHLLQNNGPSHSFSTNVANNLLKQLRWMTFWRSRLLHSSKLSSFLGTSNKVYMYSPFAACVKKLSSRIIKNLLSLRMIILALFWALSNQTSFLKKPNFIKKNRRYIELGQPLL